VVRFLTSAEVEQTLGFRGTKVVGFLRSSLATSLYRACQGDPKRESQP